MLNIIRLSDFCGRKNEKNKIKSEIEGTVYSIPVNNIKPNPNQVRKFCNRESLDELIASVKKFGVCQPITVRNINNKFYELISGERRLMAAKAAELDYIPAIILDTNDTKSAVLYLVENKYRQKLSFIEEAEGYYSLKNDYNFTEDEIAVCFGMKTSEINRLLRFMKYSPECRRMIAENNLDQNRAGIVLKIPDEQIRKTTLRKVCEMDLSIQKTAEIVDLEIEKIKAEEFIYCEQKVKMGCLDTRLLMNTVKKSVDIMKKSGIGVEYQVENQCDETKIIISIPSVKSEEATTKTNNEININKLY